MYQLFMHYIYSLPKPLHHSFDWREKRQRVCVRGRVLWISMHTVSTELLLSPEQYNASSVPIQSSSSHTELAWQY